MTAMTTDTDRLGISDHPSPHRGRVGLGALLFGLFGGPAAWAVQVIVNYALASHSCFLGSIPRSGAPPGWTATWLALLLINIAALAVALAAAEMSRRQWRATRSEQPGSSDTLLQVGEGRTRFLAMCGMIFNLGFLVAIVSDTVAILVVPGCAG
jgi:hypothetical protein